MKLWRDRRPLSLATLRRTSPLNPEKKSCTGRNGSGRGLHLAHFSRRGEGGHPWYTLVISLGTTQVLYTTPLACKRGYQQHTVQSSGKRGANVWVSKGPYLIPVSPIEGESPLDVLVEVDGHEARVGVSDERKLEKGRVRDGSDGLGLAVGVPQVVQLGGVHVVGGKDLCRFVGGRGDAPLTPEPQLPGGARDLRNEAVDCLEIFCVAATAWHVEGGTLNPDPGHNVCGRTYGRTIMTGRGRG